MNINPHGYHRSFAVTVSPAINQEQPSIQRSASPMRRIGDGDNAFGNAFEGIGLNPRMSYEFVTPADIESAGWYVIQAQSLEEKALQCLRIAQLIFRNTVTASDQKIETLSSLLMQLPYISIETIKNLLEDKEVPEKTVHLNRFQILKQT